MSFKIFYENEEKKDVKKTLSKLPEGHRNLVKNFKFAFEKGNTLKYDKDHVGVIDDYKQEIRIAAPWNYSREYTILHEIAHKVWQVFVDKKLKSEWEKIVKATKNKQDQSAEELFCMAYADYYAKNKVKIHNHPNWENFIKELPS